LIAPESFPTRWPTPAGLLFVDSIFWKWRLFLKQRLRKLPGVEQLQIIWLFAQAYELAPKLSWRNRSNCLTSKGHKSSGGSLGQR
jgi:hypothetical protein